MEQIDQTFKLQYRKYKRLTILAAFIFSVIIGPFDMASKQGTFQSRVVDFISLLAICLLAFIDLYINCFTLWRA
jgi:hypothetical protein